MWSVTYKLHLGLVCLLLILVSPKVRARDLLSRSHHNEEELNSLSGDLDKEFIQLIDRRLNYSDRIL